MDASFGAELEAAQRMWSDAGVMEASGTLVLLTYFAIPDLLAVRPVGGSLRTAVDGHREREFLRAVLGLNENALGGIGNPAVRVRTRMLAQRHREYPGMQDAHMHFIAGLLALAPLLVAGSRTEMSASGREQADRRVQSGDREQADSRVQSGDREQADGRGRTGNGEQPDGRVQTSDDEQADGRVQTCDDEQADG